MKHDTNSRFYDSWFKGLLRSDIRVEVFSRSLVGSGWKYRNRSLNEHLLYWIMEGKMTAQWEGVSRELSAGDVLWLAPGRHHDFSLVSEEMDVVHLRFRCDHSTLPGKVDHLFRTGDPMGQSQILDLLMEWRQELPAKKEMFQAGLTSFLIHLSRKHPDAEKGLGMSRKRKIMEALDEARPKEWSPSLLAHHLGLSQVHFSRLFVASFGLKPRTWLVKEKMRRIADDLLERNDTIARVASDWGYEDPFLFSRQFKGVFGESPKQWRNRH